MPSILSGRLGEFYRRRKTERANRKIKCRDFRAREGIILKLIYEYKARDTARH